ncbi:MAG: trypsin-like peptidase domain-containing protein [Armatimonadetes bacterium]|nr:trypsin-like peptidase domain-containing protein [Armatimonadota bacterium]MDE2207033.1 trypsin-like peptidase domain-containing protein [Armatimonadota bacterium]
MPLFGTFRASRLLSRAFTAAVVSCLLCGAGSAHVNAQVAPTSPPTAALATLQKGFESVAAQLEPAVVTINTTRTLPSRMLNSSQHARIFDATPGSRIAGSGSGVIISPDGWVLTNEHVVGGADHVVVKLHDGREFTGAVYADYRSDLALIKISASQPFAAARLGDSQSCQVGQWAIAIGSPYRFEGSLSVGVISSLHRSQQIDDLDAGGAMRYYPDLLQTDAAINPGNSGGPLCNIAGEVVGINTAIETNGSGGVGIGFAIPINSAKWVVQQLESDGHVAYGYLGINPTSLSPADITALHVSQGALVEESPQRGSPAADAGLQVGDVITAMGGRPILNERQLRQVVAQTLPGTHVAIECVRDGKRLTLHTTLTSAPEAQPTANGNHKLPARLGIDVAPLTHDVATHLGLAPSTRGVVIMSVDSDSASAAYDAIAAGNVIVRVNDSATPDVASYLAATSGIRPGSVVRIYCWLHLPGANAPVERFLAIPLT